MLLPGLVEFIGLHSYCCAAGRRGRSYATANRGVMRTNMTSFFEVEDDVDVKGRWYLDGLSDKKGRKLDSRDFTYGNRLGLKPRLKISLSDEESLVEIEPPLKVSLRRQGKPLDFTYADFDMPIVREE